MARPISFLPHQVPSPSSEGQTSSQWDRGSGGEEMALNTAVWVWVFGSVMCECGCLGVRGVGVGVQTGIHLIET